jgi:integrase/recombinase XerD
MPKPRPIPVPLIVPVARSAAPLDRSLAVPVEPRPNERQCFDRDAARTGVDPCQSVVLLTEFLQARSLAPNTQIAYRKDLQQFFSWREGWRSTGDPGDYLALTPRHIGQFKTHLLRTEPNGRRALSDASVGRMLGTVKTFYGWLVKAGYADRDPTRAVDLPKLPEPLAQSLSDHQVQQIFEAAMETSLPERNLALLAVLSHGLRASEVSGLNRADYDGQRLQIRQAKHDSTGVVPLSPQAQRWVQQYLDWRDVQHGNAPPLGDAAPLFASHSQRNAGQRLGYHGIQKLIKALAQTVGFPFHAHQFRHTFATNLVLQGMNPYHVMTLTRHRSVQTFRRYTKAADQQAAEQAFYETIQKN